MKKFLILLAFLITLPLAAKDLGPWVSMDLPDIDFGLTPQNGESVHRFTLYSKVDHPIRIGRSKTFCDCLRFEFADSTLNPRDSIKGKLYFKSVNFVGRKHWVPAIYDVNGTRIARIDVKAEVFADPETVKPVYVDPPVLNASWFGDKGPGSYKLTLTNPTDQTVALKLIESDETYFTFDFPVYIHGGESEEIEIRLTEKGKKNDFVESILFEYIDNLTSEELHYTIPIKRKIFKK